VIARRRCDRRDAGFRCGFKLIGEVLNRRRELTLNMIRRLHEGLGIPADPLIKIGQNKAA
jgi:hypothetical protein